MAAAAVEMYFGMSEAALRQWVEANPGQVNERLGQCGLHAIDRGCLESDTLTGSVVAG